MGAGPSVSAEPLHKKTKREKKEEKEREWEAQIPPGTPYYECPFQTRRVDMVYGRQDPSSMEELRNALSNALVIGIDMEGQWGAKKGQLPKAALLQVAVLLKPPETTITIADAMNYEDDYVFLIDVTRVPAKSIERWFREAFENVTILKLFFTIHMDGEWLKVYFGNDFMKKARMVIDMQVWGKRLMYTQEVPSLDKMCVYFLQKRLNKSLQCSNWGRRVTESNEGVCSVRCVGPHRPASGVHCKGG